MRRRNALINSVLSLALVGTAAGAWLAVGTPSAATAATDSRTTQVTVGTITSAVTASGNAASAQTREVSFDGVSGTISEIFVKAGDKVVKGAKLARLDDTDAQATLRTARASLASAQAQLATATAGQTSAEQARTGAQIAAQRVSVNNASAQLTAARQSYALDKRQQDAVVSAATTTLAEAGSELADDEARLTAAQQTLARANAGDDADAKQSAQAGVTSYQSQISQDESALTQATSALAQAQRTRESMLLRDSQAVTSQSGQLAAARAQLASQQASAAVDAQPAKPGTVASASAQVTSTQVQVDNAQDAVEATLLLAPISGTVATVNGTVGGSSSDGTSSTSASSGAGAASTTSSAAAASSSSSGFITLTDVEDLQVTAQVAEADAVKVKLDQAATATFSAAGLTVAGTVTAIDVEQTVTNNVVTYGITVTLTEPPSSLRIGQTASVSIVADSKQNVLRATSSAVTTRGATSTVTVRRDGKDQIVSVQTGLVGEGGTEITSGLVAGDTLVVPATTGAAGGFTFPGGGLGGGGLSGGGLGSGVGR